MQVKLIDNFTNKKGMTSHCYRIAYRSMERSLTDEEINDMQVTFDDIYDFRWYSLVFILNMSTIWLQWNVREDVQNKLKVELRWNRASSRVRPDIDCLTIFVCTFIQKCVDIWRKFYQFPDDPCNLLRSKSLSNLASSARHDCNDNKTVLNFESN